MTRNDIMMTGSNCSRPEVMSQGPEVISLEATPADWKWCHNDWIWCYNGWKWCYNGWNEQRSSPQDQKWCHNVQKWLQQTASDVIITGNKWYHNNRKWLQQTGSDVIITRRPLDWKMTEIEVIMAGSGMLSTRCDTSLYQFWYLAKKLFSSLY